ncbi:MAG: TRAP transporter substrate-binding protein DctP [Paracoccaceae bacterium]
MDRYVRKLLLPAIAVGLAAVGLAAATGSAAAAGKTVWNFNVWGGPRAFTAGIEAIKAELEAAAPGEFELSINYGDALGHRKQNSENIQSGAFEAGQLCVGYYPNKYPLLSVMELPFLLPGSLEERAQVEMAVMNHPDIQAELAERWNMKFFGPSFLPPYEFMGNTRIETVDDMKGVKMRISGLNAKALMVFGAVPTMVTAPDGYNALDRGTIDSFGFPYSYAFGAYKLYEVSKYVTEGLAMSGFMCFQGVNIDAWNKTPQAVRDALPAAQEKAVAALISAYRAADEKWIPIFHEKLEVVQISPETRAQIAAGAGEIWQEWADAQDAAGRPGSAMLKFVQEQVALAAQ